MGHMPAKIALLRQRTHGDVKIGLTAKPLCATGSYAALSPTTDERERGEPSGRA